MLDMYTRIWRSKTRYAALVIASVTILVAMTGCAASTNTKPVSNTLPQSENLGPSIARFENGWEGLIIIERAQLNDASRSDFESAVTLFHEKAYEQVIDLLENVIKQSPGVTAPHNNLESVRGPARIFCVPHQNALFCARAVRIDCKPPGDQEPIQAQL